MEIVLVVDDEPDIRAVVRGMLTAKGYTVIETGDPQQAIRMATQQAVHLLVTDVVMPLMKGTELAKRVQEVSPWTKVLLGVLLAILLVAGIAYYVLLKLHYHPIGHWPFFIK